MVQRCYILYYFRLYNLKLYITETYVGLSYIRSSLFHLLYKFSIPFVWIFFHSCGVRFMHCMLSYGFSYGVLLHCLLIKDYVGSLYYLHLQSVRQCLNQVFHQLGRKSFHPYWNCLTIMTIFLFCFVFIICTFWIFWFLILLSFESLTI